MTDNHTSKRSPGFTLAELLVVVGIVGVLVAIAIPVFMGSLDSAKEATCQANRRSMYGEVVTTAMTSNEKEAEVFERLNALREAADGSGYGGYTCPNGGTWSWDGNARVIKCRVHGLTADEEMYGNVQEAFNGNWWGYVDDTLKGESAVRSLYAKKYGLTTWPPVAGIDNTAKLYLQFKSWGSKSSTSYLYAGYESKITGGAKQWEAKYVCDSQGLLGFAGQWYEVADNTNIANALSEDAMRSVLNTGTKVNLVNGKFVEAS